MARIIAYTRTTPTDVGVATDLYRDSNGPDRIVVRTFDGDSGASVPLDADKADLLGTNLLELAAQLRGGS